MMRRDLSWAWRLTLLGAIVAVTLGLVAMHQLRSNGIAATHSATSATSTMSAASADRGGERTRPSSDQQASSRSVGPQQLTAPEMACMSDTGRQPGPGHRPGWNWVSV